MNTAVLKSFVRVFIDELPQESMVNEKLLEKTADVLNWKILAMPFLMKSAIFLLTCIFDWTGIFHGGRRFCAQSLEGQHRMVSDGRNSFFSPMRELLKFYQKMSVFIYYSVSQQVT